MTILVALGCGPAAPHPTTEAPARAEVDRRRLEIPDDREDGVRTFTSIPWGFATNSFWIEGSEGVVVIDTQFLPSEAERAISLIEAETDKPIVLAIVLHPNPDKFNGTDVFRAHGARVVTASQVVAAVPAVAAQRRRAFLGRYAPDYPEQDPVLESFGDRTTTLNVAGLELRLHILGRGCSEAHVVVEWNGHVFAGDLIVSQTHAWLELGYAREWIERIGEIERMAPRRVHPGRGPSGGPELLEQTRTYLNRVLELVNAAEPTMPPPPDAVQAIRDRVVAEHPGYEYPVFLFGIAAVWETEAATQTASCAEVTIALDLRALPTNLQSDGWQNFASAQAEAFRGHIPPNARSTVEVSGDSPTFRGRFWAASTTESLELCNQVTNAYLEHAPRLPVIMDPAATVIEACARCP